MAKKEYKEEIKKIEAKSLAMVAGVLGLALGAINGALLAINAYLLPETTGAPAGIPPYAYMLYVPITGAITSFAIAWLLAIIYNAFAKKFGGIKIVLD